MLVLKRIQLSLLLCFFFPLFFFPFYIYIIIIISRPPTLPLQHQRFVSVEVLAPSLGGGVG